MPPRKKKPPQSDENMGGAGKIPPQAVDIEKNVLGAMLLEEEAVIAALEEIEERDFYRDAHRTIFGGMRALYEKREPIDSVTLEAELKAQGMLDQVGGSAYIAELLSLVPSAANLSTYMRIVKQKSVLRRLIHACTDVITEAFNTQAEAENVLGLAQQSVFEILKDQKTRSYKSMKMVVSETMKELDRLHALKHEGVIGVASGFKQLDRMTAGFQKGDLIILAGRPSMGKTALSLNIARNAALESKVPVGIFSLEMSDLQLTQRFLCAEAIIDSQRLRTGRLRDNEWAKISRSVGRLAEAPIFIDDTAALDIIKLSSRARRMALENKIGLLIIDYMQLMDAPQGYDNRQQEISYISRSLKALAKQLDLPVIALSQLSRAVESRTDRRPLLSDLRESGAIEQDADLVMFVYREEFYLRDREDAKFKAAENKAEVIIGKHRNGPTGTAHLNFLKQYGRFSDPALDEEPPVEEPQAF